MPGARSLGRRSDLGQLPPHVRDAGAARGPDEASLHSPGGCSADPATVARSRPSAATMPRSRRRCVSSGSSSPRAQLTADRSRSSTGPIPMRCATSRGRPARASSPSTATGRSARHRSDTAMITARPRPRRLGDGSTCPATPRAIRADRRPAQRQPPVTIAALGAFLRAHNLARRTDRAHVSVAETRGCIDQVHHRPPGTTGRVLLHAASRACSRDGASPFARHAAESSPGRRRATHPARLRHDPAHRDSHSNDSSPRQSPIGQRRSADSCRAGTVNAPAGPAMRSR